MSQIKTVTTSAGENKISFDAFYAYVWIKNTGDTDVYVADHTGASAGDEDTAVLPAGEATRLTVKTQDVFVYGATTIEAHAQNFSDVPFGWSEGAGGGSDITVESLSVTENGVYTAPSGKAYTPVTVSVQSSALDTIDAVDYVTTSDTDAVAFMLPIQENDEIHMDVALLRLNSEQSVCGKVNGPELYVNNSGQLLLYGSGIEWAQDMDTSDISIGERRMFKFIIKETSDYYVVMAYGEYRYPAYGKLYGMKVIRNGVTVMELVPAKLHNSNVGIMYDVTNSELYRSTTGTDFTAGA